MDALDLLKRGVVALERIATALERDAPVLDLPLQQPPAPELDEVIGVSEMATILGVSARTVQRRCERGELPTMPGTPYRARRQVLLRWIADQENAHAPLSARREVVRGPQIHRLNRQAEEIPKSARFSREVPPRGKASGE